MQLWEIRSETEGSYWCTDDLIQENKIGGGWKDEGPIPVYYVNNRLGFIDPRTGDFTEAAQELMGRRA